LGVHVDASRQHCRIRQVHYFKARRDAPAIHNGYNLVSFHLN
jgi:hypothetical protein